MANGHLLHPSPTIGGLRAARRESGLSQQKVAQLADCSVSYVKLLERGFTPTESDVLPRIERVLRALNDESPAQPLAGDRPKLGLAGPHADTTS